MAPDVRAPAQPAATQRYFAGRGEVTPAMRQVASKEGLAPDLVRAEIAAGRLVIPANVNHTSLQPMAIGAVAQVKINANIGNSTVRSDIETELEKLRVSIQYGADTVMDLSTGGDLDAIRTAIIQASTVPIGTVPIYHAAALVDRAEDLTADLLLSVIERQAQQGVDYMTIHCGLLQRHLPMARKRLIGIVSRGGGLMAQWMAHHHRENPLYECYDDDPGDRPTVRRDPQLGGWPPTRLPRRCLGRSPVRGVGDPGRTDRAGMGEGRPGDDRGAGTRSDGPDRDERAQAEGALP